MGDCCNCSGEVSRDGSGQLGRYLKALDPSYALIDDRSIEELLVFTKRYANQIRFYDIPDSNIPGGEDKTKISWREFFRRDMAVIAASISQTDIWQIKKDYEELRAKLDAHPTHGLFGDLFNPILGMVVKIDGWNTLAIPENPLCADLQLAINSNLKTQIQKIVAYEEGFKYVDSKHPLNLDYSKITNKDLWGLNDTINADISIYQGIDTEEKILNAALYIDDIFNSFYGFISQLIKGSESYMQFALEQYPAHQPHMALFIAFLQLFRLAQDQANAITQRMLDFYYRDVLHLTAKPSIPDKVHIVFELAKDVAEYDVVSGTALKAGKDASGKDQVYVTETDLVINQAKVKEIKNIFIDKTVVEDQVTKIKTVTLNSLYARPVANSQDGLGAKFTDPTNTKWLTFGKGNAALNASTNICDQITLTDDAERKDQAQIGFAIASPQLVLQGGNRLLKIELSLNDNSLFAKAKDFETQNAGQRFFNVSLTGEKGWFDVEDIMTQTDYDKLLVVYAPAGKPSEVLDIFDPDPAITRTKAAYFLDAATNNIAVFLPISEQGVLGFDIKKHPGYDYKTLQPVAKIIINSAINLNDEDYKNFTVQQINVRAKVGSINPTIDKQEEIIKSGFFKSTDNLFTLHMDGLKKLVLQNKTGVITSMPFDPFTNFPMAGRSFYIGSDEVFNKPFDVNDKIAVDLKKTLDDADTSSENNNNAGEVGVAAFVVVNTFNTERYRLSLLKKRNFMPVIQALQQGNKTFFSRGELTENVLASSGIELERDNLIKITELKSDTEKGFMQLDLLIKSDFNNAKVTFIQQSINLAPRLEIKDVSVSYDSTLQLQMGIDQFYHIYPFGVAETYLTSPASTEANANINTDVVTDFATLDKAKEYLLVDAKNALLPQFNYVSPYAKYYDTATLGTASSARALKNVSAAKSFSAIEKITGNSRSINAVRLLTDAKDSITNNTNQYTGDLQEGILYIGLEKLQPLQSISMLFQFAEGSAEDEDGDPPSINWSYLSYNEWKPMRAENIVSDDTYGFQTTGIIKIDVPEDASTHSTIITDGLLWLSASVTDNANRIPQLIDIVTQAAEAVFQDQNNDASHFDVVLPAGSISKLSVAVAQVSKVRQPFASFDGKHAEVGKEFYTRVSERLRHKQRAITAWDYEHLILDRFPSIYKIKCITHTDPNCLCRNTLTNGASNIFPSRMIFDGNNAVNYLTANGVANFLDTNSSIHITLVGYAENGLNRVNEVADILRGKKLLGNPITHLVSPEKIDYKLDPRIVIDPKTGAEVVDIIQTETCCGPQIAPGHVLLIPIANLKNRNAANPLQPKTSRRTLIAIQEYLKTLTSPFVHVYAKNPVYEQIIVSFKVQFYAGNDKGYYITKLNDEIVHYLTPWAFDENAEVSFNQKIYASSIINFIEERTYVDFITDFTMGVCCNDCCPPSTGVGVADLHVNVFDNDKDDVKKLIGGIPVKIKELNRTVNTEKDIQTVITAIPAGTFTVLAYFSLFEIQSQTFTVNADGTITQVIDGVTTTISTIDFYRTTGNEQIDVANFFSHVCGCTEIEWFLKGDPGFEGDIVAEPCTPRSVLVSVPQHIIVPYIPPVETSDCDSTVSYATNTFRLRAGTIPANIKTSVPLKSLPQKVVTTKAANTLMAKKKIVETAPAKTKATVEAKKIKAASKPSAKHKKSK